MQVATRTTRRDTATRRYVTPTMKAGASGPSKNRSNIPSKSHSSPKKVVAVPPSKVDEPSTLKTLVDRFRYDEPQARPERDSVNSDFWWLHDELKTTCCMDTENDESKSNLPEFIEIFPSTDIDQDLDKRASLILNRTFSAHSSDIGQVSSTGLGSTASTTTTFQPPPLTNTAMVFEQPARPIFTRFADPRIGHRTDGNGDDDILYQWRLRRRLEQAQKGEPITFPTKVINRSDVSPARPFFPPVPIEMPTVLPSPPPIVLPPSPKKEQQQPTTTNIELEQPKTVVTDPRPIRHHSEASTQTLQDASIQTSPTIESRLSTNSELDLRPTRDDHSSVWHRPPARSKYDSTTVSSSPSPVKRHHTFRPVVVTATRSVTFHQTAPSTVQSSQDSTFTQVTPIHDSMHRRHMNNSSIVAIDEFNEQSEDYDSIDYLDDDLLNILKQKRNELLTIFREIEQQLAKMNPS